MAVKLSHLASCHWTTKSQQWTELGPEGSPERPQKDPRMFKTFKMFMLSPGTRVSVQTNLMVFQPACWCDLVQPWSHDPMIPLTQYLKILTINRMDILLGTYTGFPLPSQIILDFHRAHTCCSNIISAAVECFAVRHIHTMSHQLWYQAKYIKERIWYIWIKLQFFTN